MIHQKLTTLETNEQKYKSEYVADKALAAAQRNSISSDTAVYQQQ